MARYYDTDPVIEYLQEYQLTNDETPPENKLLAAILVRLIQDATGNTSTGSKNHDERAYQDAVTCLWLDEPEDPFSYLWICNQLDLDPKVIRNFVRAQKTPLYLNKATGRKKKLQILNPSP